MPKLKTLFILILILVLSSLLIGCGLFASDSSEPGNQSGVQNGDLPGWLLLAHRSVEGAGSDIDDPLNPKDPEVEENGEEPEATPEDSGTSPTPTPAPATPAPATPVPSPTPTPGGSGRLSPSEQAEVNRALAALDSIIAEYKTADFTKKSELQSQFDQIVRALKTKYDINYPKKIDGSGDNISDWWEVN